MQPNSTLNEKTYLRIPIPDLAAAVAIPTRVILRHASLLFYPSAKR